MIISTNKKKSILINTLLLISFYLLSFITIASRPFGDLDEIWDYTFSRGIVMGYIPYKDFSLIQLPLFFITMAIPLKIHLSFFVYRLMESLYLSSIAYLCFQIIRREHSFFISVIVSLFSISLLGTTITYNSGLLLAVFILLYFHKSDSDSIKLYFAYGLLAFTCIMFRQTSGSLIAIIEIIFLLIDKRYKYSSKLLLFLTGAFIPCFLLLSYLLVNHCFFEFWENCLFSIFRFGNNNNHIGINSIIILITSIVCTTVACIIKYRVTHKLLYLYYICLLFTIATIALPIIDNSHIFYTVMLSIVIIADCYANIITDISNAFKTIIVSSIFAEIIIYAFLNLQGTFFLQHNELAYIPSEESLDYYAQIIEHNNLYNNWGYHPVIVSESKAVFSIIDGTFEGPYHFSGMTNPVDYIINLPNDSVIVMSETYLEDNWQNPTDVYEYVINNYDVIDSYNGFNYYLKAE